MDLSSEAIYLETHDFSLFVAGESNSQDSKLEFSEDEETLITRMFNLVGERWACFSIFFVFLPHFFLGNFLKFQRAYEKNSANP